MILNEIAGYEKRVKNEQQTISRYAVIKSCGYFGFHYVRTMKQMDWLW